MILYLLFALIFSANFKEITVNFKIADVTVMDLMAIVLHHSYKKNFPDSPTL